MIFFDGCSLGKLAFHRCMPVTVMKREHMQNWQPVMLDIRPDIVSEDDFPLEVDKTARWLEVILKKK